MREQFKLTCHSRFALHRGGCKFYQIYSIDLTGESSRSIRQAVVLHWGKALVSSKMIPANCGRTSIEVFPQGHRQEHRRGLKQCTGQAILEKQRQKEARGYEFGDWKPEFEVTGDSDILEEARSEFEELFGSEKAQEILGFLEIDELRSTGIAVKTAKADMAETTDTVMVEGWGTW